MRHWRTRYASLSEANVVILTVRRNPAPAGGHVLASPNSSASPPSFPTMRTPSSLPSHPELLSSSRVHPTSSPTQKAPPPSPFPPQRPYTAGSERATGWAWRSLKADTAIWVDTRTSCHLCKRYYRTSRRQGTMTIWGAGKPCLRHIRGHPACRLPRKQ